MSTLLAAEPKKGPKKLSDVKVDPKFASTFAGMAPPPQARTLAPPSLPAPPGEQEEGPRVYACLSNSCFAFSVGD